MTKNINVKENFMHKHLKALVILLFLAAMMSTPLLAQDYSDNRASVLKWSLIMGGGIIAFAASFGAICQARSISSACEGISRNPASAPHIRFLLIFGLVLIETLVIYTLLIAIIILMVNWGKI
jgi:F-type H+-transporting ATPase subunit c